MAAQALRQAGAVVLERRRLIARLEAGPAHGLTVVSGPAGSGKSVLVASWLRATRRAGPVAWISAAREAGDPRSLWAAVASGLDGPSRGEPDPGLEALADRLRRASAPGLVVVDDHHRLSPAMLETIDALLQAAGDRLRVVLVGRGSPPLRLPGDAVRVQAAELAFTAQETGAYLTAIGAELPDAVFARLHAACEGWPMALRLILSQDSPTAGAGGRAADPVVAYLEREVIAPLDPAARRLLARTCLVDPVDASLAGLLSGRADAERVLRRLEARDALVTAVDETRASFRYHPLLRSALRRGLRRPREVTVLHRVAARWHAERGRAIDAIRHAAAARDWAYVELLVRRHWMPALLADDRSAVTGALTALSRQGRIADAELAALVAVTRAATGRASEAAAWLARAERLSALAGEPDAPLAPLALALARAAADVPGAAHVPGAARDARARTRAATAAADAAAIALTDRELGVLRLLPTHLTTQEIADRLSVSVNTVKSHMRSLYSKLRADRRGDAVERARALGLLPSCRAEGCPFAFTRFG